MEADKRERERKKSERDKVKKVIDMHTHFYVDLR